MQQKHYFWHCALESGATVTCVFDCLLIHKAVLAARRSNVLNEMAGLYLYGLYNAGITAIISADESRYTALDRFNVVDITLCKLLLNNAASVQFSSVQWHLYGFHNDLLKLWTGPARTWSVLVGDLNIGLAAPKVTPKKAERAVCGSCQAVSKSRT